MALSIKPAPKSMPKSSSSSCIPALIRVQSVVDEPTSITNTLLLISSPVNKSLPLDCISAAKDSFVTLTSGRLEDFKSFWYPALSALVHSDGQPIKK